jgi:RsiW-degrading membrane proteinase PrsW (M82 family)
VALFMYLAQLYGALQMLMLSSFSRTVRWRTVLAAFIAGSAASTFIALLLQLGSTRLLHTMAHRPLFSMTTLASYTTDPFIEEVCKVLPLVLALLVSRVRRQLGIADTVTIGAALGSGFGLTENILRFSHGGIAATLSASEGYWHFSRGLNDIAIPGLDALLTSWLPVAARAQGLLSAQAISINLHLVWSALAGLSVGLLMRRGRRRWLALIPFLIAYLDHAGMNAALSGVPVPHFAVRVVGILGHSALSPVVVIMIANVIDRRDLARGLRDEPILHSAQSGTNLSGLLDTVLRGTSKPRSLVRAWVYVLQRRSFAFKRAARPHDPSLPGMRAELAALHTRLAQGSPTAVPAGPARPHQHSQRRLQDVLLRPGLLALALPPLLYFVLGDFSWTTWLQTLLGKSPIFLAVVTMLLGGMLWRGVSAVRQSTALPSVLRRAQGWIIVERVLGLSTTVGALGFGTVSVVAFLSGGGPWRPAISNFHLIEAISQSVLITTVMFALLSLVLPPVLAGMAAFDAGLSLLPQPGSEWDILHPQAASDAGSGQPFGPITVERAYQVEEPYHVGDSGQMTEPQGPITIEGAYRVPDDVLSYTDPNLLSTVKTGLDLDSNVLSLADYVVDPKSFNPGLTFSDPDAWPSQLSAAGSVLDLFKEMADLAQKGELNGTSIMQATAGEEAKILFGAAFPELGALDAANSLSEILGGPEIIPLHIGDQVGEFGAGTLSAVYDFSRTGLQALFGNLDATRLQEFQTLAAAGTFGPVYQATVDPWSALKSLVASDVPSQSVGVDPLPEPSSGVAAGFIDSQSPAQNARPGSDADGSDSEGSSGDGDS